VTPDGSGFCTADNLVTCGVTPFWFLASLNLTQFEERPMTLRNGRGQFEKGKSGNPKGRPRKKPRMIWDEGVRNGFFDAADSLVGVVEGGKRKEIPAHEAVDLQLAHKAASGHLPSIKEFNKRRDKFTAEHVQEQLSRLGTICDMVEKIRSFPEDVTDDFKEALKQLRASLDPYFRNIF
jgi:hypothetical protein